MAGRGTGGWAQAGDGTDLSQYRPLALACAFPVGRAGPDLERAGQAEGAGAAGPEKPVPARYRRAVGVVGGAAGLPGWE